MVKIKLLLDILTVCIAVIGYLPLQPYLDPFARFFLPVALVAGIYLQAKERPFPPRILTPLSIVLFFFIASGFSMDRLITITADLLVAFLGIRLLGERSGRNCLQIFALSLFCLAASSLYNLTAIFFAYLLVLLLLLAVSLVVLTFHAYDPEILLPKKEAKKVLSVSVLMPVVSVPILLLLFVLLPRTQYPLWNFGAPAGKKIGFNDSVQPGSTTNVGEVKGVVLRAVCGKIPQQDLYWRGVVLNGFRGDAWVRLPVPKEVPAPAGKGKSVLQEIYPEPSQTPYLPALNVTRSIEGIRADESVDAVFSTPRPPTKRVKYAARSVLSDTTAVKGGIDREFYLKLPASLSERLKAKGREFARPELSPLERMRLVERFFHDQKLSYATTDLPVGKDPLGSFLFDKKRGNCEYFASCYAMLLRLAGVPARLVGGYRGGTYNAMGGYYLVTEDMAHVWVEAYLDGTGWRFVDPTAWAAGSRTPGGVAAGIRMYLDAVGFYWDKAVVTYDLNRQIELLTAAGEKARDLHLPRWSMRGMAALLAALLPLGALVWWYLRRPAGAEERVLGKMLKAIGKRYPGSVREGEGLFELAERLKDPHLDEFLAIYGGAVYGDRRLAPSELSRLYEIIRELCQHRP